ncbi:MAG: glycoside hydrolase family 88 protein [Lachnospiraceae bacterium]|nr:glycoside hydrolase family 88 protein [Lachnospiraceae bacterium]
MDEKKLYETVTGQILEKLERTHHLYTSRYPHISQTMEHAEREGEKLIYKAEENNLWTSSFFPGEMYLAYAFTGDTTFLADREAYLDSFENRLEKRIGMSHDLGFLYTLSCVADHKLTGDTRSYAIAQKAADTLYERYHPQGRYIQAWGEMNVGNPYVRIIADTMLNLPLLYRSAKPQHREAAKQHALTSAAYLVREDHSSFHTYLMDPKDGHAVMGQTHQGFRDSSTWARGQAWIVYGYGLSYGYTREEKFLEVSGKAANYFLKRLPKDQVTYWDLTFNEDVPDIRDTSAAAILACGLLELEQYLPEQAEKEACRKQARAIVSSLCEHYFYPEKDSPVLLTQGMYHRDNGSTGTIWGDYFFLEALLRLQKDLIRFW